jgi:hypothetical protein
MYNVLEKAAEAAQHRQLSSVWIAVDLAHG